MGISSITILGGDLRQCYTAEYLQASGWNVTCWHTPTFPYHSGIALSDSLKQALEHSDFILAPTPVTRDNIHLFQTETADPPCPLNDLWETLSPNHKFIVCNLQQEYKNIHKNIGCKILCFGSMPYFQKQNSKLTAEGLLAEVIRCTPFALSSASLLLFGYGCCGTAIGKLFLPLCKKIYLIEQDPSKQKDAGNNGIVPICKEDFAHVLPECQLVINTVPASILDMAQLSQLHSSCHIFDIASAPFGFPADTTEQCLLPYYRIPGIPGRFAPVTAGEMIAQTIERMTEYAL